MNLQNGLMLGMYSALFIYLAPLLFISVRWLCSTDREQATGYLKFFHPRRLMSRRRHAQFELVK